MEPQSIGQLVDQLFRTHLKPDGKEFSFTEVANALHGELDPTYIGKLRNGKVPNPGRNALSQLCDFFKVPASYFFPELDTAPAELTQDEQLTLALRSSNLPKDIKAHIEGLIRAIQMRKE